MSFMNDILINTRTLIIQRNHSSQKTNKHQISSTEHA